MVCMIEPLGLPAGMLRPGNATANNAGDQLAVVDEAIGALPAPWRAGHAPGDDPSLVRRRLLVRADTASGSNKMLTGLAARNVIFSVGMRTSAEAAAGIQAIDHTTWRPAVDANGQPRDSAQVTEAPQLVPAWAPAGTRAIVRRERPHPGASLRLWDYDGWRHQVVLTNAQGADIAAVEAAHRGHAQVENRIKNLKDTGLARLPFADYTANRTWVELVLLAAVCSSPCSSWSMTTNCASPSHDASATPCSTSPRGSLSTPAGRGCTSMPPGRGPRNCSPRIDDCPNCP